MLKNKWLWLVVLVAVVVLVALTAVFVPSSHPAFDVAINFVKAAGAGAEAEARRYLHADLIAYAQAHCRDGRVTHCVDDYTPPEWGEMLSAVFRRAEPDGPSAWDVAIIATYAENQGFSGVCIYNRVEQRGDTWQIVRWAGFISCDEPNAGLSALSNPDAPNRVP